MDQDIYIKTFISTYSSEEGYLLNDHLEEISINHEEAIDIAKRVLVDGDYMYLQGSLALHVDGQDIWVPKKDWSSDILLTWEDILNFFIRELDNEEQEIIFLDNTNRYFMKKIGNLVEFYIECGNLLDDRPQNQKISLKVDFVKLKKAIMEEARLFLDFGKKLPFREESNYESLVETYRLLLER
ncbi:hypothetical protein [Shouchella tritolerans]|uniref:hypothetical protein n=1 Tax=Shouchella tritolerans TaxID=2979466 RepID=UPI0007892481|nr:hypothetical protein [Shouchella tritolerans]